METISTSQLRTKSSELIKTLANGNSVSLIHRSNRVGTILPSNSTATELDPPKKSSADGLKKLINTMSLSKRLSIKQRNKLYEKHLTQKYG